MKPYAVSFDWRGRRCTFTARVPAALARFVGRHLWRLGSRRWQIEQGRFATSHIPTGGEPATREAEHLNLNLHWQEDWQSLTFDPVTGRAYPPDSVTIDEEKSSPRRFVEVDGRRCLLLEGERTNLALWSAPAP